MQIYNTMTRQNETLTPIEPNHVRMYTCGPTVYNYAHIGNFRAYMFEDILRRYMGFCGFRVTQVMNLTDVDDKTIRGAIEAGRSLDDYTRPFKDSFFRDIGTLRIEPAEHYPAATDHIDQMVTLIETLIASKHAYLSEDGSVYFEVNSFDAYGALAHLDKSGLQSGARVAQDEYDKENVSDFALWKSWTEADGDVGWDSPWGRGRPGWHIECSAMSMTYLGNSFDLHTGGIDNMFPHHENEIAQSEAATGESFVRYWMHCGHLIVDGAKMSKSLGNFYTLADLLDKGYAGREIRYVLLSGHYRQRLNFTIAALDGVRTTLQRLDAYHERLSAQAANGGDTAGDVALAPDWATSRLTAFQAAMDDDLNTPEALAALFDMVHAGNKAMDDDSVTPQDAVHALAVLQRLDSVFDILQANEDGPDDAVVELAAQRQSAREAKDFAESDRLRDAIAELGWSVLDTAEGPKLRRVR
jgi:cysteinyl-tRNA synthetase